MKGYSFLDHEILALARLCANKVSRRFKIRQSRIRLFDFSDPERRNRGICYGDGDIYINTRYRKSGKFYSLESTIDTVIHELNHLQNPAHDRKFWADHKKMKRWFFKNF